MAAAPEGEIAARPGGAEIGHQRAEPHFLVAVVRHRPDHAGVRVLAVEVGRLAHAELEAGIVHGAIDRRPALRPVALDDDRAFPAVDRLVAEIDVVLDGDEER